MTRVQRASLSAFATAPAQKATEGTVQTVAPAPAPAPAKAYPKINVYLTADEVRTLKLIGVETGERLSDIGAKAIREWLERNGHARPKSFSA